MNDLANDVAMAADEERRLRAELAAAYRIVDHAGLTTRIYNHITLRLPGPERRFLINAYGLCYDEVKASNLVTIDIDGNVIEPGAGRFGRTVNPAGFVIHRAIHAAREDAHCVAHVHTVAGTAVAAMECGLLPISLEAMILHGRIGYHDFEGITVELDEGPRLVKALGEGKALILRNHGLLTVGRSVAEAIELMLTLQRACEVQVAAMAGGAKLTTVSAATAARVAAQSTVFDPDGGGYGDRAFAALMRLMDRRDPSYRD